MLELAGAKQSLAKLVGEEKKVAVPAVVHGKVLLQWRSIEHHQEVLLFPGTPIILGRRRKNSLNCMLFSQ